MRVREIVIFRHNLFKLSEPFIAQQAQQLRRYRPLFVGRLRFGEPPDGTESLVLRDLGQAWALPRIGLQMVTRSPRPYLRLLGDRRPSLIHAHFGIEGVYALPVARDLQVPLVTTFHGFDATLSTAALLCSPAWANYPLFRRRLARQGDLFLCASSFIRDRLLSMGFPEERTRVHYIGVDCQAVRPRNPAEETPTILHVARLVEVKGTQFLIRAFRGVAQKHAAVQLVIIGEGPLRRPLENLVRSLELQERVQFLGGMAHFQVLAWMRKAAMLVVPSVRTISGRVEGFGLVSLEAAATGVPVIGSHAGGIPEAVSDGETGFLAPERDVAALAGRMNMLLDAPDIRHRMGVQARAFVERRFDMRQQTRVLEELYDAVLGRRAGP